MTKMLVTGINGFTGQHLVDLVRDGDIELFGLGHREEPLQDGVAAQYVVDLCDLSRVKQIVQDIRPDLVVHLAGAAFVHQSDFELFYKTNLIGSRNLFEALGSVDYAPQGVLIASSANVYGNLRSGAISEAMQPDPVNDYGVSKLSMEFCAHIAARSLPIIIARPFNYTGVGQSIDFVIPKIIDHMKRKAPEIMLGNIDVARDFSDVRDVVRSYMELLGNPAAYGQTVNICSGIALPLLEVINVAQDLSGHRIEIVVNPDFVRKNEIQALWGDRDRLASLLEHSQFMPISQTIQWMLDDSRDST